MCTGSTSGSGSNGWSKARGVVLKTLVLVGGALLLKRFTKSTTRWDHARIVADSLAGEKFSREQASREPDNYFNLRWLMCPAAEMVDGSSVLYFEQAFWRTPHKPFRQRFFMVKPCSKEMKCDVELCTYAIRDSEEYKNFCDRSKDQRPQPEEVIGDIAEHLTTIYLKRCDRGKRCLYEGSTPADGFPNTWGKFSWWRICDRTPRSRVQFLLAAGYPCCLPGSGVGAGLVTPEFVSCGWAPKCPAMNGASYCTSELTVLKNHEIHSWDRGYDDEGNQVWGVTGGPYEFKPAPASSVNDTFSSLTFPSQFMEKRIEGSFVLQE